MAVGLKTGSIFYKIGTGDFLHSFFSSIAYNLENNKWGSRFPFLMNDLYKANLKNDKIDEALKELEIIKKEFDEYDPSMAVWDIENLAKRPPWEGNIAERITSLSNYFYTSDGQNLFDVFSKALDAAKRISKDVELKSV